MSRALLPPLSSMATDFDDEPNPRDDAPPALVRVQRTLIVDAHRMRQLLFIGGGALTMVLLAATIYHYAIFLPHPEKASKLYLLDTVFEAAVALLIMLCAATVGARIMRLFPMDGATHLERGLFAYGLGTGALALATAVIGLLHGYYFPVIAAELLAPLVVWRADLVRVVRALTPMQPRFVLGELRPRSVYEGAIFTVCVILILIIMEHTLVPFWGFDVFMYHFALPERFLQLHQLFGSPGLPQANLPFNNEMLNLLALNFGADIGAVMVQTMFVGAMLLATFALGVRLISRRVAWLGMALFLTTPLVLYYTSSGLIDQQFAFMSLLAVIAMLEYRDSHDRRWVIMAGLLIGIGVGVKYQIAYLVAPLLLPFAWWCRPQPMVTTEEHTPAPVQEEIYSPYLRDIEDVANDEPTVTIPPATPSAPSRLLFALGWGRSIALNLAILSVCAAATFALWAIREWVQVGNPIYPLVWNGAEWNPARMLFYKSQFDNFGSFQGSGLFRHLFAAFDWYIHWHRYDYTPLPPVPVECVVVAAPVLLLWGTRDERWRRVREGVLLLVWLTAASLLLWGFVDQLVPRYVLPTFGLIALLTAFVLDRIVIWLTRTLNRAGRDVVFAIMAAIVLVPGVMYSVQARTSSDPAAVYTGAQSYQRYLQSTQLWPSYWAATDYFNNEVPLDTKLLGVNLAAGYFFHDPYLTPDMNLDMIFYLSTVAPTEPQKLAWLHAHGYRYIIYDRHVTQWAQGRRDTDDLLRPLVPSFEAFLNHQLVLVRSLGGTDIYWIPADGLPMVGTPSAQQ